MAVASATSNGLSENSAYTDTCKRGWLSKRTHFTFRWKQMWFEIKGERLLYGDTEKKLDKFIGLVGAKVDTPEGDGSLGWTITPKDTQRTFYLRASTTEEQQSWMLAICEAQLSTGELTPNACVIQ